MRKHLSVLTVDLLILSGAMLLAVNTQAQGNKTIFPPMGKLVDAGGHLLHVNARGNGGPVVIMEAGSGDFSFIWGLVQPKIARFTTAVTYDRAGFAWSDPGPNPRTGHQIAFELHTALQNAGIKGPYILVGQSFGGFLVRIYARFYPNEVAGMVLVDALNEDSRVVYGGGPHRIRESAKGRPESPVQTIKNGDHIAIYPEKRDSLDSTIEPPLDKLPDTIQKMQIWAQSQAGYRIAADSEMSWSPEDVADMYVKKGNLDYLLGDKPLIVLSRGDGAYNGMADSAALENERLKLQADLAHLSTNSKHIIDKHSGHNIHLEDPELVVESIKQVYEAVVHHAKLTSD